MVFFLVRFLTLLSAVLMGMSGVAWALDPGVENPSHKQNLAHLEAQFNGLCCLLSFTEKQNLLLKLDELIRSLELLWEPQKNESAQTHLPPESLSHRVTLYEAYSLYAKVNAQQTKRFFARIPVVGLEKGKKWGAAISVDFDHDWGNNRDFFFTLVGVHGKGFLGNSGLRESSLKTPALSVGRLGFSVRSSKQAAWRLGILNPPQDDLFKSEVWPFWSLQAFFGLGDLVSNVPLSLRLQEDFGRSAFALNSPEYSREKRHVVGLGVCKKVTGALPVSLGATSDVYWYESLSRTPRLPDAPSSTAGALHDVRLWEQKLDFRFSTAQWFRSAGLTWEHLAIQALHARNLLAEQRNVGWLMGVTTDFTHAEKTLGLDAYAFNFGADSMPVNHLAQRWQPGSAGVSTRVTSTWPQVLAGNRWSYKIWFQRTWGRQVHSGNKIQPCVACDFYESFSFSQLGFQTEFSLN